MKTQTSGLTNLQLELLKIFSISVSEKELLEIKRTLVQFFSKKAITAADEVWDEKKWSQKDAAKFLKKHIRTRYRSND